MALTVDSTFTQIINEFGTAIIQAARKSAPDGGPSSEFAQLIILGVLAVAIIGVYFQQRGVQRERDKDRAERNKREDRDAEQRLAEIHATEAARIEARKHVDNVIKSGFQTVNDTVGSIRAKVTSNRDDISANRNEHALLDRRVTIIETRIEK